MSNVKNIKIDLITYLYKIVTKIAYGSLFIS